MAWHRYVTLRSLPCELPQASEEPRATFCHEELPRAAGVVAAHALVAPRARGLAHRRAAQVGPNGTTSARHPRAEVRLRGPGRLPVPRSLFAATFHGLPAVAACEECVATAGQQQAAAPVALGRAAAAAQLRLLPRQPRPLVPGLSHGGGGRTATRAGVPLRSEERHLHAAKVLPLVVARLVLALHDIPVLELPRKSGWVRCQHQWATSQLPPPVAAAFQRRTALRGPGAQRPAAAHGPQLDRRIISAEALEEELHRHRAPRGCCA
eukprot:CAMPEP_0179192368 /NCGR_PEP_ID=MMETSP0796-20121207/95575_1 /TAXON_ID=73915 /ORGANISM="Pyrodinium bahamense, Strain pbaha01" /LENGTH=265 /DNA_ID=CAMNT_0020896639 /DNA_START=310 /DNA_END=1107 /DNA_ORIENTATION=+